MPNSVKECKIKQGITFCKAEDKTKWDFLFHLIMFGDFSSSLSKTFDCCTALLCKHLREIDSAHVRVVAWLVFCTWMNSLNSVLSVFVYLLGGELIYYH